MTEDDYNNIGITLEICVFTKVTLGRRGCVALAEKLHTFI